VTSYSSQIHVERKPDCQRDNWFIIAQTRKSSVNENKVYAMTLTKLRLQKAKSGRTHLKAWQCGRGEVSTSSVAISPICFSSQLSSPFFVDINQFY